MTFKSLHSLNWHTLQYAQSVAIKTEKYARRNKEDITLTSYPACVACFQHDECGNVSYGYSGQYKLQKISFRSPLLKLLKDLGSIGGKSSVTGCKNRIGRCAEVCAVNTFLLDCARCKIRSCHDKSNILDPESNKLSEAYRPRTLEHIERCKNCEHLFGLNF